MALIELDLTAPPAPPASRPPARRYRLAGLVLAAVLLLALGGAAPPGSPLWRYLGLVPAAGSGPPAPFQLASGRIYTMVGGGTDRMVTAWTPEEPPRRLWTARFPARVTGPDQVAFGGLSVRQAGGVVLLSDGPATTALDARTGQTRWTSPVVVRRLGGDRFGVAEYQKFPAGSLYDQDSGDPGELYFSSTGEPHTKPPITTEVRGIDLATGATAWSVSVGGSVDVFAGADVTVLSSDRLTVYSTAGAVTHETPLPEINGVGPYTGEVDGDTLLVDYGGPDSERRTLVGYRLGTLERRWSRPEPAATVDQTSCTSILCATDRGDVAVLDPATGRPLWRVPKGIDLVRRGDVVLENRADPIKPYRVVDPATGDPRTGDLSRWNADLGTTAGHAIVLQQDTVGGASAFGVVVPGHSDVQVLGQSGGATSGCAADDRYVVCQDGNGNGLRIWAYRA